MNTAVASPTTSAVCQARLVDGVLARAERYRVPGAVGLFLMQRDSAGRAQHHLVAVGVLFPEPQGAVKVNMLTRRPSAPSPAWRSP